jgi:hypothetical protein
MYNQVGSYIYVYVSEKSDRFGHKGFGGFAGRGLSFATLGGGYSISRLMIADDGPKSVMDDVSPPPRSLAGNGAAPSFILGRSGSKHLQSHSEYSRGPQSSLSPSPSFGSETENDDFVAATGHDYFHRSISNPGPNGSRNGVFKKTAKSVSAALERRFITDLS